MKILRSRWFYIILANVLILAMLIMGIGLAFRHFTKGELYEADGFTQNSLVYFEEFSASDKLRFQFTVVNDTNKTVVMENEVPDIHVFQGGAWEPVNLGLIMGGEDITSRITEIPPFSSQSCSILGAGKIIGENGEKLDPPAGIYRLVFHTQGFDIVGYVTFVPASE